MRMLHTKIQVCNASLQFIVNIGETSECAKTHIPVLDLDPDPVCRIRSLQGPVAVAAVRVEQRVLRAGDGDVARIIPQVVDRNGGAKVHLSAGKVFSLIKLCQIKRELRIEWQREKKSKVSMAKFHEVFG